jgi:hypothetical protein
MLDGGQNPEITLPGAGIGLNPRIPVRAVVVNLNLDISIAYLE